MSKGGGVQCESCLERSAFFRSRGLLFDPKRMRIIDIGAFPAGCVQQHRKYALQSAYSLVYRCKASTGRVVFHARVNGL